MNRKMRLLGIVALLFFVAGCSGYRTVGSFGDGMGSGPGLNDLRPGDEVRLHLKSGSTVQGEVKEMGQDSLTIFLANPNLWRDQRYVWYDKEEYPNGVEPTVEEIPFQDLHEVEVQVNEKGKTAFLLVGAVMVVGGLAIGGHQFSENFWRGTSSKSEGPVLSNNQRILP